LARLTVINGAGVPKAPGGLGINNFGYGSIGLYWNAVTEAADDAYIDPAAITYTVRRNGETVAEGLTDTWFDDMLAIPDTYLKLDYEVCAVFAGNVSEAASVSTGIGAIEPPYADKFGDDKNDSGLYTTINVNDDGGYWWFSPYYSSYIYDYGSEDADDWLISPAFALRGGMTYELDYTISGNSTMYTERYAVAMGVAPTERAMVTELLAPVEITSDRSGAESVTLTVTPPSDGNYYFGWHALSDGSQFQIHLRDIRLSAPMASCSPAEVTGISLVPDSEGHLRLHGSFRTPELDISGNALSTKCSVTVMRSDINCPLAAFNDVAPGTELEFDDDNFSERGVYQYIIYCTDSDGNIGRSATASVYVGPLAPADVPEVRLVEGEVPGTALLSWTAPLTDIEGNPLNPANLTYMVYVSGEYNKAIAVLDEPTAERQAAFTVCKPDEMAFATYYVEALNLGLESNGMTRSPMVPVGKAETLPYSHSFNESHRGSRLFGYIVPADSWATVTVAGAADGGVRAADGDDAYLKLNCSTQGGLIDVFTGKINLAGAENPAVSLYHYKWSEADRNIFEVVAVDSEGNETSIGIGDHATEGREGWNFSQFPLDKVKGQCVKILVRAVFNSHEDQLFDALAVSDRHPVDLVATGLTAPARVEPAKTFSLTAGVANAGTGTLAGYSVDLLLNGETVATESGPELQPGEQTAIEFSHTLSPLASGTLEFRARINAEGDGNESDNLSEAVAPELVTSAYP
ncbi:MAG: choice-of-anchor J domain-containing protein, partial [Muribaculaceae bacterium]|nr:choice-of-anchor J domain-containing protein [Muribaculaceae bacterium]